MLNAAQKRLLYAETENHVGLNFHILHWRREFRKIHIKKFDSVRSNTTLLQNFINGIYYAHAYAKFLGDINPNCK